jgi:hypothetical protein
MTLEERRHIQETADATCYQLGAIMREFDRLGFGEEDRAERLAVCARIAGLESLASTRDLHLGEAGLILRTLMGCRHRGDLPPAPEPRPPVNWSAIIAVALYRSGLVPAATL